MSTVAEIETAIEKLRPDEFAELTGWVTARRRARKVKEKDIGKVMTRCLPITHPCSGSLLNNQYLVPLDTEPPPLDS
ncbi:MAG: hypothetical protein EOP86_26840 [Verrucomicrobiaceae bacterium]|nr:MAG: hypothetical protein EOP86_26840 [Verrucomicrobiaceae bacterium]